MKTDDLIRVLANDSKSQVPEPLTKTEPKQKVTQREQEDAIPLKSKHQQKSSTSESYRLITTHGQIAGGNVLSSSSYTLKGGFVSISQP